MAWNLNDLRAANPWAKDYTDDELIKYTAQSMGTTPDALMGRIGYERDKPWTSDAYEIGRQLINGTTQAAGMVNKAGAMFSPAGSKAEKMFSDNARYWDARSDELRPEMAGRGPVAGLLIKGAQALPPSAVAMGATALNPYLGAAATMGGFGGSQAWDTYTKGLEAGLDPATAKRAALQTGVIEGAGEFLADVTGTKLLSGVGRGLNMARKGGVEGAVKAATDPRWVGRAARDLTANAAIQSGTEYAQNYAETAVENAYGISNDDPHAAGKEGFEGGLGLSMLLAPLGVHAHRGAAIQRGVTRDLLNDTNGDLSRNVSAANAVRSQITPTVGKDAADQWYASQLSGVNDQRVAAYQAEQTAALDAARNEQAAQAMGFPDYASYEAWVAQSTPQVTRTNAALGMAPEAPVPPGVVSYRTPPVQFNNTSPAEPVMGPLGNWAPSQAQPELFDPAVDVFGMTAGARATPAESAISFPTNMEAPVVGATLPNQVAVDALGMPLSEYRRPAETPIQFTNTSPAEPVRAPGQGVQAPKVTKPAAQQAAQEAPAPKVKPLGKAAQAVEDTINEYVASGRLTAEDPLVISWNDGNAKTAKRAVEFGKRLQEAYNAPTQQAPVEAAKQITQAPAQQTSDSVVPSQDKIRGALTDKQRTVFDHLMAAVQAGDTDSIIDAEGKFKYAEIGNALGMARGSAKSFVDQTAKRIASLNGVSVDELRTKLRERTKQVRTTEESTQAKLGDSPANQESHFDESSLFGDGTDPSAGIIESVGGSQSDISAEGINPEMVGQATEPRDAKRAEREAEALKAREAAAAQEAERIEAKRQAEAAQNAAQVEDVADSGPKTDTELFAGQKDWEGNPIKAVDVEDAMDDWSQKAPDVPLTGQNRVQYVKSYIAYADGVISERQHLETVAAIYDAAWEENHSVDSGREQALDGEAPSQESGRAGDLRGVTDERAEQPDGEVTTLDEKADAAVRDAVAAKREQHGALVSTAVSNMLRTNGVEVTPETLLFGYKLYENSGSVDAKTGSVTFDPADVAKLKAFAKLDDEITADDVDFDEAPAIRSLGNLVPADKQLSAKVLAQAVDQALAQLAHRPKVHILDSVRDLFRREEPGSTMGVVFKNEIYLFRDAIGDRETANDTLWHELLHYGIRRVMTESQYIAKMQELARVDAGVAKMAREWAKGPEGQALLRQGKTTGYVMARGVDEALAELSARMQSTTDAFRNNSATAKLTRALVRWSASLAQAMGFHKVAANIRSITNEEARQFVVDVLRRMQNVAEPVDGKLSNEPAFQRAERSSATQAAAEYAKRYPGGELIVDDAANVLKKVANHLKFLPDLVESVKGKLPSAAKWYDSVQKTATDRRKLQEDAERIATRAAALRAKDLSALNSFLSRSTIEQKWGYDAEFKNADGTVKRYTADPEMARVFQALPQEAQEIAKEVFDHGEKMARTKFGILKQMGLDGVLDPAAGKLDGPYAPLKRFGKYIGVAKSKELVDAEAQLKAATDAGQNTKALEARVDELKADPAHYLTPHFDTMGQARRFAREVQGYHFSDAFEKSHQITEGRPLKEGTLEKVLAAVRADKGNLPAGARESIEEMVRDLYFSSMDEHHARMSGLKRKNRAGYDPDMIRSFLAHARAEAAFLSQLKHGAETNQAFYEMQREVKGESGHRETQDAFNAIADHYAENLKYKETPIQDRLMTMATVWQLAMSPAYHLANSLQTVLVTLPKMAADFNDYAGAWRHIRAGYQHLRGNWGSGFDLAKIGDARLREVLQAAEERGVLDVGLDENLAQFESTRTGYDTVDKASVYAKKAVHKLRQVSRAVELANRVSTGAAAYSMAREKGLTHEGAKEYAIRTLQTTQGDTTRANKPLILKKLPKLVGQYRGYQLMMAALYTKGFKDAFAGEDAQTRAIGRRFLAYKMAHTAIASGAMGLPLMPVFSLVAAGLSAAFGDGDDDEPFDTERTLREAIGDDDVSNLVLHGPLGLIGVDLSTKLGEERVFMPIRPQDVDLTSRDGLAKTAFSLMGPAAGLLGNFADGLHKVGQGDYYKGIERFMPSGVAQAMSAFRVANEGFTLNNGDVMVAPEDISAYSAALEALGMPTSEIRRIKWLRDQQYELKQYFNDRTKLIERQYADAARDGDGEMMADLREQWMALQNGKDNVRPYFNDRVDELKRQPLSTLLKYPRSADKRERKLQAAVSN